MSYPLCYTVRMMIKETNITYIPSFGNIADYGWLEIDGECVRVVDIHSWDDFGQTQDTFILEDGREYISQDEGETFQETAYQGLTFNKEFAILKKP